MGLICLIVQSRFFDIGLSCAGALLFCFYFVLDTQIMLSGKHCYYLCAEEYIFAALNLYVDVVFVIYLFFVYLFKCVKKTND